jgi:cytoskeletal protein RodZ
MTSQLKEAREKAGYTIDYVADKLNIRKQYLIALEEEDYESIPGQIYIDGYTKMYYEFLGISLQPEQNDDLLPPTQTLNSINADIGSNKYKKYIILFLYYFFGCVAHRWMCCAIQLDSLA